MTGSNDLLRDLLVEAAGPYEVASASVVRGRAQQRRARRRAVTAGTLTVAAAVVAVGAVLGLPGSDRAEIQPAPPVPTATGDPTPEPTAPTDGPTGPEPTEPTVPTVPTAPSPDATAPPDEPPITQADLADFRFADEERFLADPDFPAEVRTDPAPWSVLNCVSVGSPASVVGMRTLIQSGPDTAGTRQIAVFADASAAEASFAQLRGALRGCQAQASAETANTFVGGQLALADESFWSAIAVQLVLGDGSVATGEAPWGQLDLLVLDRNVIVLLGDGASSDDERVAAVPRLTAEWEALRPQYADLLR